MTDRIAELRALHRKFVEAPMETGDRYTAMRLYEIALVNAAPALFDCAEKAKKLVFMARTSAQRDMELIYACVEVESALTRLNGDDHAG